jgi:flagellar motor switch protein FliM
MNFLKPPPSADVAAALPLLNECIRAAIRRLHTRILNGSWTEAYVRVRSVQTLTAAEVFSVPEVQNTSVWAPCEIPNVGAGFWAIEDRLLDHLIGWLFGDVGRPGAPLGAPRTPTTVEIGISTRLCNELYLAMETHWPVSPAPHFLARSASSSRHTVTTIPLHTSMIAATIECGQGDTLYGCMTLALPAAILEKLTNAPPPPVVLTTVTPRVPNYTRLLPMEMEIIVELARLRTPMNTLENLEVGQELTLGSLGEVRALVNGRPSFVGEAGETSGRRSFRITRRAPMDGPNLLP